MPRCCRLDEEPRGSSEGGKRNRHLVDLLFAGNALTVAWHYGQHQPASDAPVPKFASIFEIGTIFFTFGERMNSH